MTQPDVVTVHYERKFSDGNYGSEGASITVTYEADEDDDREERPDLATARRIVLGFLAQSPVAHVARQAERELNPPKQALMTEASDELEDVAF